MLERGATRNSTTLDLRFAPCTVYRPSYNRDSDERGGRGETRQILPANSALFYNRDCVDQKQGNSGR